MSHRPYSPSMSAVREVLFLVGEDGAILWSDASDSPVRLPDSRVRWEAIWSRRDRIAEIAHSHPIGPLAFSREDETTMRALASALGRPILFSIVAPDGMVRRIEERQGRDGEAPRDAVVEQEPWWSALLRLASGMHHESPLTLVRQVAAPNAFELKE